MKSYGVVIYGAGQRGRTAFEILTDSGICIKAIADRMSIVIGNIQSISLNELCEISNDEVCIVTPNCDMTREIECLKRFYSEVVDYGIVNFLNYYIPIDHGDNNLVNYHPFNHYESPYPDNVGYNYFANTTIEELSGIDLSYEDHLDYYNMLKPFMKEFIESITDEDRYSASNDMFPLSDAARYSGIIRLNMPKK